MTPHKIGIGHCEAAKAIQDVFGTDKALAYRIGEKLINFLEAACPSGKPAQNRRPGKEFLQEH